MGDVTGQIVVLVGPSLTKADRRIYPQVTFRPPVAEGDVARLCAEHPSGIGIVDGFFRDRLSVFHKEILWAMASGIPVYGAASMGALRAAELDTYGMVGVGEVYRGYRSGRFVDDGDVAIVHGPAALDYTPLTIAYVDVEATAASLLARGRITEEMAQDVRDAARSLHFSLRTWAAVAELAASGTTDPKMLRNELSSGHVERKRLDALELVHRMTMRPLQAPLAGYWPPQTAVFQDAMDQALAPLTD